MDRKGGMEKREVLLLRGGVFIRVVSEEKRGTGRPRGGRQWKRLNFEASTFSPVTSSRRERASRTALPASSLPLKASERRRVNAIPYRHDDQVRGSAWPETAPVSEQPLFPFVRDSGRSPSALWESSKLSALALLSLIRCNERARGPAWLINSL
ncbi:hypothetical protein SKAU_G00243120 [Synaphobranchus kaupii]|uniref:Uncharacterized protein n=1 Tax=Synaphobranchus kaupii TaxID=118154 RepID=A0A9Q1F8D6_SYNKA|nr:hypothetical protein SKAU_G00243120 [Synaphobranchus kaupii]